ncbi:MAG: phosphodiester glycosidase family protein [Clostridia bacterium]|nr:phosphodiester glycosidase family protein [Clostridia bacterium]
MKKKSLLILTLCLVLLAAAACSAASAETLDALELKTTEVTLSLSGVKNPKNLTDRKFTTYSESKSVKNPSLTLESSTSIHGLYLCFQKKPESYEIQVKRGGDWETLREGSEYIHAFYELDGVTDVRVYALGDKKQTMGFNEVYIFGEGRIPEWVQRWEPTPEKSDLLFVVAHPEEELLYLGGAIPYYAREMGRTVAVACMSYANTTRRSELLNGLWSMGYRNYPIIGSFKTAKVKGGISAAYKTIDSRNGQQVLAGWLNEVLTRTKPEVMVGPDEQGEGGNAQRMMLADACRKAFDGAEWQVQKLYLHLYGGEGDQVIFDWNRPLEKLGGRTGMGLAYYAYLFHKTQDDQEKSVYQEGITYANNTFGLAESLVGPDLIREDLLENIPLENLAESREQEPVSRWTLEEVPGLPALNEKGFLDEGEFIWSDDARGHYVFINAGVKLIITRKFDGSMPLTWFETEIWCDVEAGEKMVNVEYTPEKPVGKKSRVDASKTAVKNRLVFACNSDYYTYRVGSKNGHPVGIEIRNGEIYYDDAYDYLETKFFPNLDTLAFYEDGHVDVHASMEMTAQDYLDQDAYMVFSFGPYLIRDGKLSDWVQDPNKSRAKNPRHAFGMIEPGHYVDIMCEGRLGSRSEGVTMPQLAFLCQAAGCTQACDLDGGQTAVVVFMGQQLNKIGKYDGKTAARETCEVLGIGFSDQVGSWNIQ